MYWHVPIIVNFSAIISQNQTLTKTTDMPVTEEYFTLNIGRKSLAFKLLSFTTVFFLFNYIYFISLFV